MCHDLKTFLSELDKSLFDDEEKISIKNKLIAIFQIMSEIHTDKLRKYSLCVNPTYLVKKLSNENDTKTSIYFSKKYEQQLKPIFDKLGYVYF
jgi:hypothetical protein